jgi:hypothetical protein
MAADGVPNPLQDPDAWEAQPPEIMSAWIQRLWVDGAQPHEANLRIFHEAYAPVALACEAADLLQSLRALDDALRDEDGADAADPRAFREHVAACEAAVAPTLARYVEAHARNLSASRKLLVELTLEEQQLAAVLTRIDGALRQMWKSLTASRPVPGDSASVHKLRALVERADGYRDQLQRLQQVADLAIELVEIGQGVIQKRDALIAALRSQLPPARRAWQQCMEDYFAERGAAPSPASANAEPASLAAAMQATERFTEEVASCLRICLETEIAEQELAQQVKMLGERLAAG